jgi:carbonic anhydrase
MDLQLPALLRANEAYHGEAFQAALRTPRPSGGLVILTCMDARLDLFRALGLEVGQAHILRNAGGRASGDAIRSLVVSTHLLGTREIGVIHHTNCGLEGKTEEDVALATGVRGLDFLAFSSVEDSVRADVEVVRTFGHLPEGTVVWGAVYDVDSGAVRVLAEPQPAVAGGTT